jgi:hypothetical protein
MDNAGEWTTVESSVHVLLLHSSGSWAAHMLEWPICACATTLEGAEFALEAMLLGYVLHCRKLDIQPFIENREDVDWLWRLWHGGAPVGSINLHCRAGSKAWKFRAMCSKLEDDEEAMS